MIQELTNDVLNLMDIAAKDPEYQQLLREYEIRSATLIRQLTDLSQIQQNAVTDYCGLLIEMHTRLLELALRK